MSSHYSSNRTIEKQYGHIRPELAATLYNQVNKLHPENLNWEEWLDFINTFKLIKVRRGDYLVKEGQVCQKLYFLLTGILRCYVVEDGRDINLRFYFPDQIASEFHSLRSGLPSSRNLICMSPCILLEGCRPDYLQFIEQSHPLTLAAMAFFAQRFQEEEEHTEMLKAKTPAQRYQYIVEHEPHLLKHIPLSQLSSYLGISRKSLSRIRSEAL